MRRREFLRSSIAAAVACAWRPPLAFAQAKPLAYADMHTHFGVYGESENVRDAMQRNGMLLLVQKIVADGAVIRRTPGKGYHQVREPLPGELAQKFDDRLKRLHADHKAHGLLEVTDVASLQQVATRATPGIVLGSEGGDFLNGDIKRLQPAREQGLVHLQLVHYRVSEVGDVSTERPVHNGLTAFGKEVVAACNRLGILVDVAHCTSNGIEQALNISTRPMIYSHGQVGDNPYWTQSARLARAIATSLARRIAEKGGVIGLWPLASTFRTRDAYAGALIDLAEKLGADHVGIGSDMPLAGGSVVLDYEAFADVAELLAKRGASSTDINAIMGGNYLRVLRQALAIEEKT